jgi:hypothetical protein
MGMEPEDGLLFICDADDDINLTAFAPFGVECLKEVIEVHKANRKTLTRVALLRYSPHDCHARHIGNKGKIHWWPVPARPRTAFHVRRKEPAGVLTGVVFEDTIHKLCARHEIPHQGVSLEPLLTALNSKSVLTPLERKEGTTAAALRTSATHARWTEFESDQVKTVLAFTRRLLRDKLGA